MRRMVAAGTRRNQIRQGWPVDPGLCSRPRHLDDIADVNILQRPRGVDLSQATRTLPIRFLLERSDCQYKPAAVPGWKTAQIVKPSKA